MLVLSLETLLPDDHPLLVVVEGRQLEFIRGNLPHISKDMSKGRARHVPPLRSHLEEHIWKLSPQLLEGGDILVVGILHDQ